jgi:putative endonuclease
MKPNTIMSGAAGEITATGFLRAAGFSILERNWRFRKFEVDIIAREGDTLVFIEVKSRKNNTFAEPEVSVTRKKQRFLVAAAHAYITEKNIDLEARFDIVAITGDADERAVNHIRDAFYPVVK